MLLKSATASGYIYSVGYGICHLYNMCYACSCFESQQEADSICAMGAVDSVCICRWQIRECIYVSV
jgi:hypothetical protein